MYSSLITGVMGISYSSNVYITGLFYESETTGLSQGMLYISFDNDGATGFHAGIGHVGRNPDGSFGQATWATVQYLGSLVTSANTVYENYIMGVYTSSNTTATNSYTAAVPWF